MDLSESFIWVDHYGFNCAENQGAEKGGWSSSWLRQVTWVYRKEMAELVLSAEFQCTVAEVVGKVDMVKQGLWALWALHMLQFWIPLYVNQKLNFTLIFLSWLWYCYPNERFLPGLISMQLPLSFGSHSCCNFMLFLNPNPEFSRDT